jgi:hypothetical protein
MPSWAVAFILGFMMMWFAESLFKAYSVNGLF